MRRCLLLVLLVTTVATLAAGCRFSKVNAKATVHISGRAVSASGAPLAGVQVRLFKEADLGEALTGIVLALGSLGTICLLPAAPAICRQARVATTAADGSYTFTLSGADTQGTLGTESTLDLVVSAPGANAARVGTTLSFNVRKTTVQLPVARLWNAAPRVAEGAGRIKLRWLALPPAAGRSAAYSAQLYDPTREAPVWSQPASSPTRAVIDARVLEDRAAGVAASARTTLDGRLGTGDVHASYLSARVPVRPISGAPPSRHRPCLAVSGTDLRTTLQHNCAATDGDLLSPARLSAPKAVPVSGVVIDLGRIRPIHLVVARGLSGSYIVELSGNGVTYRTVATGGEPTIAADPPGNPRARFVRVRSPGGLDEGLLTEVSVW